MKSVIKTLGIGALVLFLAGGTFVDKFAESLPRPKRERNICELVTNLVNLAKAGWPNQPILNVAGKISATNYFFQGRDYFVSIPINKSGKIDGIAYQDNEHNIFDIPDSGWGINSGLDFYLEKSTGFKIDDKSSAQDFKRANREYLQILKKISEEKPIKADSDYSLNIFEMDDFAVAIAYRSDKEYKSALSCLDNVSSE